MTGSAHWIKCNLFYKANLLRVDFNAYNLFGEILRDLVLIDKVNFQNSNLAGTKLTMENPEHVILSLRSSSCT